MNWRDYCCCVELSSLRDGRIFVLSSFATTVWQIGLPRRGAVALAMPLRGRDWLDLLMRAGIDRSRLRKARV